MALSPPHTRSTSPFVTHRQCGATLVFQQSADDLPARLRCPKCRCYVDPSEASSPGPYVVVLADDQPAFDSSRSREAQ